MSVSITQPPLLSGLSTVSRAIATEFWLDLGRPSEQQVLELARQGREEARMLCAIDKINKGDDALQKEGWKTIKDFGGCGYGAIYELQVARADKDFKGGERIFKTLIFLSSACDLGRPWALTTLNSLYEMDFFQCYDGSLIDEKYVRKNLNMSSQDDNVYAGVAISLYEKGLREKGYEWAAESVKRGEIGAYHIHAYGEQAKNGCDAYQRIMSDGVDRGCPTCCMMSAQWDWEESSFGAKALTNDSPEFARRLALTAARSGKIKGMILYGMMCESGFGGEKNAEEVIGAMLTAYICEPSDELATWIYRVSSRSPAMLGIAPALDWMIRNLDYPMTFQALAIAGHLKDTFSIHPILS